MNTLVTPEMLAAYNRDFLAVYVPEEKRDNAVKALANICKLYAIRTMQESSEQMTKTVLQDLLSRSPS